MAVVLLVIGLVLLVVGADLLVRGASHLAIVLGISPLVVGLTVVAFGTGAPELSVSIQAATSGSTELALGNVVGSNLINTLPVLGVAALVTPLVVNQKLVRREVPLVVAATVAVYWMARDGEISGTDGIVLTLATIIYVAWAVVTERRESPEVQAEYAQEYTAATDRHWAIDVALIVVGLGVLLVGSAWLVDGAVRIAESLGLSELVIGLTIVALGTSAPEAATSVVAGLKGERDIAVGNVVGSNLFNLLAVLGITAWVSPTGIPAPDVVIDFDLPVLVGVSVLCLAVFFTGWVVERWEGFLFIVLYLAYLAYLLLEVGDSTSPATLGTVLAIALPVVVGVVVIDVVLKVRAGNPDLAGDDGPGEHDAGEDEPAGAAEPDGG